MKIKHISDYARRRMAEYPPITEQLDALWKGGEEAEKMRAAVAAVKLKYAKPAIADAMANEASPTHEPI